jgi:hypothetical protein
MAHNKQKESEGTPIPPYFLVKNDDTAEMINYKGIYFDDDNTQKYTCPRTGAHFEFQDMCRRIKKVQAKRQ